MIDSTTPDYNELGKQWPGEWAGDTHDPWVTVHPDLVGLSLTARAEIAFLLHHTPETGKLLEIGTACGVTAALIAKKRPGLKIVCIDNFSMSLPGLDCLVGWQKNKQPNMKLWYGTTDELIDWLNPSALFDVIYVDADHAFDPMMAALRQSASLLRPDGIITVHDWGNDGWPDVKPAVDAFCRESGFTIADSFGLVAALRKA